MNQFTSQQTTRMQEQWATFRVPNANLLGK
jgi:hypothetical protein